MSKFRYKEINSRELALKRKLGSALMRFCDLAISRGVTLFFISDGTNFQFAAFFNLQFAMLMTGTLSLLITPPLSQ